MNATVEMAKGTIGSLTHNVEPTGVRLSHGARPGAASG